MSKSIVVKVLSGKRIRIPATVVPEIKAGDYVILSWNDSVLSVKKLNLSKALDL